MHERDVETDHGDRRADRVADEVVPDRRAPSAGRDRTAIAQTAFRGTRFRATFRQSWWPGTAPSRENANIIRDADVTRRRHAEELRHDADEEQELRPVLAHRLGPDPRHDGADVVERALGARDRERDGEQQDPAEHAPRRRPTCTCRPPPSREAWCVSSAMCAEASKPVIVYCESSRPRPNTNQNVGFEKLSAALP